MTTTVKRYELLEKNVTAVIPTVLASRWDRACKDTGLTNAQAFFVAITLFYADPTAWVELDHEDLARPTQGGKTIPNFRARLKGITGTWLTSIQDTMANKRLAANRTGKVTQTDVLISTLSHFCDMSEQGRLMAPW